MSATRDKSQSVGFVYTNIYQLYKKGQQAANAAAPAQAAPSLTSEDRVWRPENLGDIKITKFQPRTLSPAMPVKTAADIAAPKIQVSGNPFDDLKNNLTKLQDLHSKLRFMLTELEELVGKK